MHALKICEQYYLQLLASSIANHAHSYIDI